jgi:SpoVK/Ycf46/Vps4 family AAA+-type ATPase
MRKLTAQQGNDLERLAIVGIFQRLLDYYRGILFLTTNRADVLDTAVLSRMTLRLSYPDLTNKTRLSIWRTMLSVANLQTDDQMSELTSLPLNGRQIRNIVRLARIVHAGKSVTASELKRLVRIAVPDLPTQPACHLDQSID